ncbi:MULTISPECIES: ATP-binding protein [Streptomyces]|uniref:ATP-binding protein n=1 Tax=Streptomyces TaxID=1883 RepID=UPI00058DD910|nr:ATP-binding protein [Streptomyces sp. SCSIO ZS0520]
MPEIPLVPSLWRFPARPASVARARRAVVEALPRGLWPQIGEDLHLLTSELVTNAVRHGARAGEEELVEMVLWPADGHYWLAVSDPGEGGESAARMSEVGWPSADSESGRGLVLVDHLAATWAVRPRPVRGKSVIAGLPLPGGGWV